MTSGDDIMKAVFLESNRDYDVGSPSRQVKRNSVKLKQLIASSRLLKDRVNVWIEGVVVFTNPDVELQLTECTVSVLKIDELCDYIRHKKSNIVFSSQELLSIGKTLLGNID